MILASCYCAGNRFVNVIHFYISFLICFFGTKIFLPVCVLIFVITEKFLTYYLSGEKMVISIKRALAVGLAILFTFLSIFVVVNYEISKTSATMPLTGKIIAIDAGHGGIDGGAVSKNGISEKDINLKIANYLKNYLEKNGAKVIMTRIKDESLHSDDKGSIKSKKRSDLINRRNKVNNSDADIFISVHLNFFEQSQYKGAQVFYESAHPESVELAQLIQQELKSGLDKENNRQTAKIDSSKILYQNLTMPSVLVECGFLSNPEEAEKLTTKEYQEKVALSVSIGVIKFFAQKNA